MALAAATVWEVRTAGNDTNGGGFVTGASGTDYSQQDAKNTVGADISTTDAVAAGTTTITSATANFGTTIVGNIVYFQGGTGAIAAQWRQVTARASTVSITIDASIATSTGMTMNIGGALLSPGIAASLITVAGMTVHQKAGTYAITSATPNIVGGTVSIGFRSHWHGYQTTRNDLGTKPILLASGIATASLIALVTNQDVTITNMEVDGATLTAIIGFNTGGIRCHIFRCKASRCTNGGFRSTGALPGKFYLCEATLCTTASAGFEGPMTCYGCYSHDNTVNGFSSAMVIGCISDTNTGDGFDNGGQLNLIHINSTAYGNTGHGFDGAGQNGGVFANCLAESNGAYGFMTTSNSSVFLNCGTYNNTSGATSGTFVLHLNHVIGTSSFFTNAAAGDFSLNNTVGGGASARAASLLGVFPGALSTGYLDIGAVQHGDPAGGGSGGQSISIFGGP